MKKFLILLVLISNSIFSNDAHHEPAKTESHEAVKESKPVESHDTKAKEKTNAHADTHHKREAGPVSSEKAFGWMKNGNTRFLKHRLRTDGISAKDLEKLSKGQKPHTIVLSCSDSRVPPEIVFDQRPGEIFVVRTAGQALDSSAIASIEYAVSHLGSNLIVVLGHESCGAVKAALGTLKGGDAGSQSLNKLVADLHPRLKRFSELTPTDNVVVESWANVEGVATDLLSRSEIIQSSIESGEVRIQKGLYHLATGEVEWR